MNTFFEWYLAGILMESGSGTDWHPFLSNTAGIYTPGILSLFVYRQSQIEIVEGDFDWLVSETYP